MASVRISYDWVSLMIAKRLKEEGATVKIDPVGDHILIEQENELVFEANLVELWSGLRNTLGNPKVRIPFLIEVLGREQVLVELGQVRIMDPR